MDNHGIFMDSSTDIILPLLPGKTFTSTSLAFMDLSTMAFTATPFNNCSQENKNKYMLAYCHWLDPYICGVQGTSRPHVFHFSCHEEDVQMFTKDYHSSASPWMGPYSFLNLSQLNTTILKDTLSALTELNNAQAMKKSYQDLMFHWISTTR
ncbi:uncharacterized protein ACA1_332540 [Acanthamoeba castellanii str. Neff]|uniref:Uncharacterized protein n=1 Tax=Acanthamoeba castellanii (strain ATCC 30010 / Neff) TaxID=1257118 RepID=L8GKV0_ACACF|nr:uncharacterized protein ACA1_332540 [Acanthamoeba castellanii str. Neff]ELR13690.1 hypothetical protein ACA1_332540 [Acanthamoeba castellanii str. Neff]